MSLAARELSTPTISKHSFGKFKGIEIDEYILSCGSLSASILTWGGIIRELWVPDRMGVIDDIVLGFDSLEPYTTLKPRHPYFGAIIGPYANRIGGGKFTIDGTAYSLAKNDGENNLHSGPDGFDRQLWIGQSSVSSIAANLVLNHISVDGHQGYPGSIRASVSYTLTFDALDIRYRAETSKPTFVNLTNHSYFNLAGHDSGSIGKHQIQINATKHTPFSKSQIPTGTIASVKSTWLDFTARREIDVDDVLYTHGGYDHNFVLSRKNGELAQAALVDDPASGRVLEVLTTEPGMQFYTGKHIQSMKGKRGAHYQAFQGFCLETQKYPDSPNHPYFPSALLRPGETYESRTIYKFGTEPVLKAAWPTSV